MIKNLSSSDPGVSDQFAVWFGFISVLRTLSHSSLDLCDVTKS